MHETQWKLVLVLHQLKSNVPLNHYTAENCLWLFAPQPLLYFTYKQDLGGGGHSWNIHLVFSECNLWVKSKEDCALFYLEFYKIIHRFRKPCCQWQHYVWYESLREHLSIHLCSLGFHECLWVDWAELYFIMSNPQDSVKYKLIYNQEQIYTTSPYLQSCAWTFAYWK